MPTYKLSELNKTINGQREIAQTVEDVGSAAKRFDATEDEIITAGIYRMKALASSLDEAARNFTIAKRQILNKRISIAVGEIAKLSQKASELLTNTLDKIYDDLNVDDRREKIDSVRKRANASSKKTTVNDPIKALVQGDR